MWTEKNYEHPALIGAFGWLPGDGVDIPTMERTADRVFTEWRFSRTWGWDFPMLAMCAARLGRPDERWTSCSTRPVASSSTTPASPPADRPPLPEHRRPALRRRVHDRRLARRTRPPHPRIPGRRRSVVGSRGWHRPCHDGDRTVHRVRRRSAARRRPSALSSPGCKSLRRRSQSQESPSGSWSRPARACSPTTRPSISDNGGVGLSTISRHGVQRSGARLRNQVPLEGPVLGQGRPPLRRGAECRLVGGRVLDEAGYGERPQSIGAPAAATSTAGPCCIQTSPSLPRSNETRSSVSGLRYRVLDDRRSASGSATACSIPASPSTTRPPCPPPTMSPRSSRRHGPHVLGLALGHSFYGLPPGDTKWWGPAHGSGIPAAAEAGDG